MLGSTRLKSEAVTAAIQLFDRPRDRIKFDQERFRLGLPFIDPTKMRLWHTGLAFMSGTVHPAREFDHRVLLHWISLRHIEAYLGDVRIFQR
jgi:hypothetical protein